LVRAAQNFQQFHGTTEAEGRAWLTCIAEHEVVGQCRQHLGVNKRAGTRGQNIGGGGDGGVSLLQCWVNKSQASRSLAALRKERASLLANVLAALPEDYREILTLRHLDGLDFAEAARRMGRSSGAVRVLWTRALKKLREAIKAGAAIE